MSKILIKNTIVITMNDNKEIFQNGDILIEGNKISYVGDSKEWKAIDKTIDGQGKVALPGLVNAHTHAAMTLFRGYADDMVLDEWLKTKIWPREALLEPEDVYWGTKLAIVEMIKTGTTSFADMYFYTKLVGMVVDETGIRASLCGVLLGFLPTAREDLKKAAQFIEDWQGAASGRITTMFGPHSLYTFPVDLLKELAKEAERLKVGVHIHLLETKGEEEEIKKYNGKGAFEILEETGLFNLHLLAAHSVYLSHEQIAMIRNYDFVPVHTGISNMKLACGIAPVPQYLKAGIAVALGTDGPASNNNLDLFEEMKMTALLHKVNTLDPTVISDYEALAMATRGGAKALALEDEIGQLKEGMKADIILVDLKKPHLTPVYDVVSNLVYSAIGQDVSTTIVDGKILMEDYKLTEIDEIEVIEKVEERAKILMSK